MLIIPRQNKLRSIIPIAVAIILAISSMNGSQVFAKIVGDVPCFAISYDQLPGALVSNLLLLKYPNPRLAPQPINVVWASGQEVYPFTPLIWGGFSKMHLIVGDDKSVLQYTGFSPGELINYQIVQENGEGFQFTTPVDSIFIFLPETRKKSPDHEYLHLLIKCKPISKEVLNHISPSSVLVASKLAEKPRNRLQRIDEPVEIPEMVSLKLDSVYQSIIPEEDYGNTPIKSIVKISYVNGFRNLVYLGIVSFCPKGCTGYVVFLSSKGEILTEYYSGYDDSKDDQEIIINANRITGITDVNRDGVNEVVILWGDSYGGGELLVEVSWNEDFNRFEFSELDKITTMED